MIDILHEEIKLEIGQARLKGTRLLNENQEDKIGIALIHKAGGLTTSLENLQRVKRLLESVFEQSDLYTWKEFPSWRVGSRRGDRYFLELSGDWFLRRTGVLYQRNPSPAGPWVIPFDGEAFRRATRDDIATIGSLIEALQNVQGAP